MDFNAILSIASSNSYDPDRNKSLESLINFSLDIESNDVIKLLSLYSYDSERNKALNIIEHKITGLESHNLYDLMKLYSHDDTRNEALRIIDYKIKVNPRHLPNILKLFSYDDYRTKALNILTPKILSFKNVSENGIENNQKQSNNNVIDLIEFINSIKNISGDKLEILKKFSNVITIPDNINDYCKNISQIIEDDQTFLKICTHLNISENVYLPCLKEKEAASCLIEIYELKLDKRDLIPGKTKTYELAGGFALITRNHDNSVLINVKVNGSTQKVKGFGPIKVNRHEIKCF